MLKWRKKQRVQREISLFIARYFACISSVSPERIQFLLEFPRDGIRLIDVGDDMGGEQQHQFLSVLLIVLIAEQGAQNRDLAEPGNARFIIGLALLNQSSDHDRLRRPDGEGRLCGLFRKNRDIARGFRAWSDSRRCSRPRYPS